ncbi:winged helix DNA-binding domain-containing protein [Aggregatilinea lenta]|uniref:winged helix DNA-binding domain-containing protein n=1 Tax=Aggregatilinea lenta TaxID=913108 RepID=UPI000E5A24D0|nr:winged helix DNA-binding domain-containing protein [Aggregatilinea lenta]
MEPLTIEQVRMLRLRAQRLHPDQAHTSSVADLVRDLGGLQAQELPSAVLGIRVRSHKASAETVRQARETDRSIVLTWAMRGTRYLVAAADLGWMLPLFGPLFIERGQRRYKQLGLDATTRTRAANRIAAALADGAALTRAELADVLAKEDIPVAGQAIAHLVGFAALSGVICFGPERGGELTYVALPEWTDAGDDPGEAEALARLARRYLGAYSPAALDDFANWSGLPAKQARAGLEAIEHDLVPVEVEGSPAWMPKGHAAWLDEPPGDPVVRLLPAYDGYLLGYKGRDFMVSGAHARRIHPGGGLLKPTLIVDGCARGVWKLERTKRGVTVVVAPFEPLDEAARAGIDAEVGDLARFLDQEPDCRIEQP